MEWEVRLQRNDSARLSLTGIVKESWIGEWLIAVMLVTKRSNVPLLVSTKAAMSYIFIVKNVASDAQDEIGLQFVQILPTVSTFPCLFISY